VSEVDGTLLVALAFGAGVAAALLTPAVGAAARAIGAVDVPSGRRKHPAPVPRLGGLAVALAVVLALGAAAASGVIEEILPAREAWGTALGSLLILVLGIADDTRGVRVRWKLAAQLAAAVAAVAAGLGVPAIDSPLGSGSVVLGAAGVILSVVWIVAITNAFNLIDGLDGLAAGVALIATATLVVLAALEGRFEAAILGAVLAGALAGFLVFNFHPASIFLGDTGSLLLGYWLALLSIMAVSKTVAVVLFTVPVLVLGFPIADVVVTVIRRGATAGLAAIVRADRQHLHHRVLDTGLSHRRAVLAIWAGCALLGVLAFAAVLIRGPLNAVVLALATAAVWAAVRFIERRSTPPKEL
jgi:UDP-GlcNAc:undecaprenyl-phosphate/decaprenyl-phosphate GlcNAc-1-phosphate transferase